MVNIILEPADNGVVKRVKDDNHGGGNNEWSSMTVYESDKDKYEFIMKFFYDLCDDLGFDLGNKFSNETVTIRKEWGTHYKPTKTDINNRIKELQAEIELLKGCKTK